jgi:hypothetical protein
LVQTDRTGSNPGQNLTYTEHASCWPSRQDREQFLSLDHRCGRKPRRLGDWPPGPNIAQLDAPFTERLTLPSGSRTAGIDDLNAAVLRFLDPIGGRDQQVTLALGDDLDLAGGDTILLQLSRD